MVLVPALAQGLTDWQMERIDAYFVASRLFPATVSALEKASILKLDQKIQSRIIAHRSSGDQRRAKGGVIFKAGKLEVSSNFKGVNWGVNNDSIKKIEVIEHKLSALAADQLLEFFVYSDDDINAATFGFKIIDSFKPAENFLFINKEVGQVELWSWTSYQNLEDWQMAHLVDVVLQAKTQGLTQEKIFERADLELQGVLQLGAVRNSILTTRDQAQESFHNLINVLKKSIVNGRLSSAEERWNLGGIYYSPSSGKREFLFQTGIANLPECKILNRNTTKGNVFDFSSYQIQHQGDVEPVFGNSTRISVHCLESGEQRLILETVEDWQAKNDSGAGTAVLSRYQSNQSLTAKEMQDLVEFFLNVSFKIRNGNIFSLLEQKAEELVDSREPGLEAAYSLS